MIHLMLRIYNLCIMHLVATIIDKLYGMFWYKIGRYVRSDSNARKGKVVTLFVWYDMIFIMWLWAISRIIFDITWPKRGDPRWKAPSRHFLATKREKNYIFGVLFSTLDAPHSRHYPSNVETQSVSRLAAADRPFVQRHTKGIVGRFVLVFFGGLLRVL
jgi:hypothetical protein